MAHDPETDPIDPEPQGADRQRGDLSPVRPDLVEPDSERDEPDDPKADEIFARFQRTLHDEVGAVRHELVMFRREIEYHQGPLPHPRTIQAYNDVVPGAADMIFREFEEQGKHRRQMESYALRTNNYRSFSGLCSGFIVSIFTLWVCYRLGMNGHAAAATILGAVDLVALASVFVYGSQRQRSERVRKAEIMAGRDKEEDKDMSPPSESASSGSADKTG